MKILFILDLFKPHIWWVEILFDNVINKLVEKWNEVIILTSKYSKNVLKYEKTWNIEIYRVGHNRYDFMLYSIFKWIKLAKKCDIIHSTTYNSAIPSSIIAKLSWKKIVLTVHEIFWKLWYKFMWGKWFFFKLFESLIFKFPFDKYICVSNYTKNNLRIYFWLDDKKLITIYNWIDYSVWDRSKVSENDLKEIIDKYELKNCFTWLFFGRSWISKWLSNYIESIPDIVKKIPNFKAFLIVSESNNNKAIKEKELIKKLKIEKNIIWINSVKHSDLKKYILASNVVIVPSLVEWFWFAACETCAIKKELIVSELASLPEVVSWKINYINPSDIKTIVKAFEKSFNNNYQNIAEKIFSWDENIDKTLDIYKEVLWK